VYLSDSFRADGEVRLLRAQINDNLECDGGTFRNVQGRALNAEEANIRGSVLLRNGFSANGEVNFYDAEIARDLVCSGGTLSSLRMPGTQVAGNLILAGIETGRDTVVDLYSASCDVLVDDSQGWPSPGNLHLV
jgi:hypothetical protein